MRQAWIVALTTWFVAAAGVVAEPLSLRDAMQMARNSGRTVAAARARQSAAEARLDQAKGFRLPSVSLEEMFIRTDSPADAFALKLNQERFSFADFMVTDPNRPEALNTAITRLELQLPLFTGGELSGRIAQAELAARAATREGDWIGHQAALDAAEAYVMISQAREYVGLLERAKETVAAHVKMARAYVDQGMLVRSELLRAQVELSRIEDLLLEAKGNAHVAEASLAFSIAADQTVRWELATLPTPVASEGELADWLAAAGSRPDLEAARAMLKAGEIEEKVRSAAFLPTVGVVARGDLVDDTLFGSHGRSTSLIAVAKINLFAGGSDRAAVLVARHEAEAGRADVQRFEEGIALEVRQRFEEVGTALARHRTAAEALRAARETERITRDRFASGVVKMIDLLDASTALREAETRELVARAAGTAALLRLAVVAGRAPESVL